MCMTTFEHIYAKMPSEQVGREEGCLSREALKQAIVSKMSYVGTTH